MKHDINRFDTSDYSVPYDIPLVNKKIPRLMKDENNGAIMNSLGLKQKCTLYMYKERRTCKGKRCQKQCCGRIHNVQGLHSMLEQRNRNVAQAIVY